MVFYVSNSFGRAGDRRTALGRSAHSEVNRCRAYGNGDNPAHRHSRQHQGLPLPEKRSYACYGGYDYPWQHHKGALPCRSTPQQHHTHQSWTSHQARNFICLGQRVRRFSLHRTPTSLPHWFSRWKAHKFRAYRSYQRLSAPERMFGREPILILFPSRLWKMINLWEAAVKVHIFILRYFSYI